MTSRIRSVASSLALTVALVAAAPVSAATMSGSITGSTATKSCFAGSDGSCSGDVTADPAGVFSAAVELSSPDSPLARGTRYSQALARYTIGFDLAEPTSAAEISVRLRLEEADTRWAQDTPEIFGGTKSAGSGAKVLFQLLGHSAPSDCGCGWFGQSSPSVVAAEVREPEKQRLVSNWPVELTMSATNPYGDNMLPAGRYEVLLRAYALADLVGSGDWGTLTASVNGQIQDVTVSTAEPALAASNLTLSVSGNGASKVLNAGLTDADSAPIDGRTISFYGGDELLGTAVTQDGVATLPLVGKFRGGNHVFRAEFAGDDSYAPASAETR